MAMAIHIPPNKILMILRMELLSEGPSEKYLVSIDIFPAIYSFTGILQKCYKYEPYQGLIYRVAIFKLFLPTVFCQLPTLFFLPELS